MNWRGLKRSNVLSVIRLEQVSAVIIKPVVRNSTQNVFLIKEMNSRINNLTFSSSRRMSTARNTRRNLMMITKRLRMRRANISWSSRTWGILPKIIVRFAGKKFGWWIKRQNAKSVESKCIFIAWVYRLDRGTINIKSRIRESFRRYLVLMQRNHLVHTSIVIHATI